MPDLHKMSDQLPDPLEEFFVDRDPQTGDYHAMLQKGKVRILCIQGAEGIGKTFLLERLKADPVGKNCLIAKIDFSSQTNHDADQLEVLHSIATQMDGEIKKLMIPAKPPGVKVDAAGNVNIPGKIVGGDEIHLDVNQNILPAPKPTLKGPMRLAAWLGLSKPRRQVEASPPAEKPALMDINLAVEHKLSGPDRRDQVDALTQKLIEGLQGLQETQYAILFLDNFDQASTGTHDWLMALLDRFWTDEIKKLIVVMTGQCDFRLDPTLFFFVHKKHVLSGFDEATARQYCLEKWERVDPEEVLKDFPDRKNISPMKLFLKATECDAKHQGQLGGLNATPGS